MKLEECIAENLKAILDSCNLNPKNFSDLCVAKGLGVNKSFISRLFNNANYGIDKLSDVVAGINLLPGFDWVTISDLVTEGKFVPEKPQPKVRIDKDQLQDCFMQTLVNMDEMEWITLNSELELKTLTNYCIVQLKTCGIEAIGGTAAASAPATKQVKK